MQDIEGVAGLGHVGITPVTSGAECSRLSPAPEVSGDFVRAATGDASGELLISTDTSRIPPELCRRWDVRFLSAANASTEFVFYVPENPGGTVATGRVYTEDGQFIQGVAVTTADLSFERSTQELSLLARSGAIERELAEGLVGNISTVHRKDGQGSVAVPGACRRPPATGDLGPEAPLVVPYFEVEPGNPFGRTTLFAVRNATDSPVLVRTRYFLADGTAKLQEDRSLVGHATRTVNLRDVNELGVTAGYVQLEVVGSPPRKEQILSGDYIRIEGQGAAGSALVDTSGKRSPRQLCHHWVNRFGEPPPGAATSFVFFIPGNDDATTPTPVATGTVYNQEGAPGSPIEVHRSLVAFEISAAELNLEGKGSIEWDLRDGLVGNVATVFRSNGKSVLVPGTCADP